MGWSVVPRLSPKIRQIPIDRSFLLLYSENFYSQLRDHNLNREKIYEFHLQSE